jgi:hypothetical protein
MAGNDELSPDELATRAEKPPQEGCRDRERWIGDDEEGPPGQAKVGGIRPNDGHVAAGEPRSQQLGSMRVQFDGHDPCSRSEQALSDRSRPRADIQHEIAGSDVCVLDEAPSPSVREPMPTPPRLLRRGHDGPSL